MSVWSRIGLQPEVNPKPETGGPWFDQSLVKEREASLLCYRTFLLLTARGLIRVRRLFIDGSLTSKHSIYDVYCFMDVLFLVWR